MRLFGIFSLIGLSATFGGSFVPVSTAVQEAFLSKPNVVFIPADDHALEAISAYGSYLKDYAKTPNIDRLAREGMLFRNTICNNSICSPSRASFLTGQYSRKNGVKNLKLAFEPNATLWFISRGQKRSSFMTIKSIAGRCAR